MSTRLKSIDAAHSDRRRWLRMAVNNVAKVGRFSSDRTISEYARDIWKVRPCKIPLP